MNRPLVDIVICAHNHKELTARCLDSLLAQTYPDYRIILVDDCSTDDSAVFLKKQYPQITILENKKNLGAAKARNVGIKTASGKYLVTMDNDAALAPDWLEKMVVLMESDGTIGQAGGKILSFNNPKALAGAGGSMQERGKGYDIGLGKDANDPAYNKERQVLFICSASMIIRRQVLDKVGGFCDIYFHGYEDADLSLKLNIAGYRAVYHPEAVSYHMISATVRETVGKKSAYYSFRNRLFIMFRNYEFKSLLKYLPKNLRFTLGDCWRHRDRIVPAVLSWLWIISRLPIIIIQRKEIRRLRKVKDVEIHKLFNLS